MNSLKNSMKKHLFSRITRRGWIWISILYVGSILFYLEFFTWLPAIFLGLYMTIVLVSMLLVGYINLGHRSRFPTLVFSIWVAIFSIARYVYIYYFLSRHLPEHTIFHYVDRVIPTVIFTSASMIFLGYSYAIYEWGLAAREKYKDKLDKTTSSFKQPLILRADGSNIYVLPEDITYISANGEYVNYHTDRKKYMVFKRLKDVEQEMKSHGFLRNHRSYIVNPDYIVAISKTEIQLKDDTMVPLSKSYRDRFGV